MWGTHIKHKCKCGAEAEFIGQTFINGGGKHDSKGRVYIVEVRADEWLDTHKACLNPTPEARR